MTFSANLDELHSRVNTSRELELARIREQMRLHLVAIFNHEDGYTLWSRRKVSSNEHGCPQPAIGSGVCVVGAVDSRYIRPPRRYNNSVSRDLISPSCRPIPDDQLTDVRSFRGEFLRVPKKNGTAVSAGGRRPKLNYLLVSIRRFILYRVVRDRDISRDASAPVICQAARKYL